MVSIFGRLFGKRQEDSVARDVAVLVEPLTAPAIHLVKTAAASRSHFGGTPNLPQGTAWPERNGKRLGFLARLSLSELHGAHSIDWLPNTGALLFFYDMEEQTWGFDPKDRGSAVVLLCSDLPKAISPQSESEENASTIPRRNIAFRRIDVIPSWERDPVRALQLSRKEDDLFFELADNVFKTKPKHQVAGFPSPVQGDYMELECQLVTNGLYCGSPSGYKDERAQALKPGAENWRLLFQMDTDDELGIMWGDAGTIYFWVEEQAARSGNFQNTWLILQCA